MKGKLFIISAPSGAGKTTIVSQLISKVEQFNVQRVVTYTSRKPRKGEISGKDYFFVTKNEFEEKINEGFFIEWSGIYGHYYGSPVHILDELISGRSFFLILDIAGVCSVSEKYKNPISIWISPPSLEVLEHRLRLRGTDSDQEIKKRLSLAEREMDLELKKPIFDYYITNYQLNLAVNDLQELVLAHLDSDFFANKNDDFKEKFFTRFRYFEKK